jgi:hypothetical protein
VRASRSSQRSSRFRNTLIAILCCCGASCLITPQSSAATDREILVIDLADAAREAKRAVTPGVAYDIALFNLIPNRAYAVESEISVEPIPPLEISKARDEGDICDAPQDTFDTMIAGAETELAVRNLIADARARAARDNCSAEESDTLERYMMSLTTRSVATNLVLDRGEKMVITVERRGQNGATAARWSISVNTGSRGEWRVSYGFNFLPNQDEEFFSEQDPADPTSFTIVEKRDREDLDFAPSVFFTWFPQARRAKQVLIGPVFGLGFDFEKPIVFAGGGITWNENVMFTLGGVVHSQKRLDGRYAVGQTLTENLAADQLEQETFGGNIYFGVSFRLGSNPFKTE